MYEEDEYEEEHEPYWINAFTVAKLWKDYSNYVCDIPDGKIYILPPPVNDDWTTDEDSDEDHEIMDMSQVGKKLLVANFDDYTDEETESDEEETESDEEEHKEIPNKRRKIEAEFIWEKGGIKDIRAIENISFRVILPPLSLSDESHPIDYFKLFWNESFMEEIAKFTNNNSLIVKNKLLNVTLNELYSMFGILIFTSFAKCRQRNIYWGKYSCGFPLIYKTMDEERFNDIFSSLYFSENKGYLNFCDKLEKIRPLINHINTCYSNFAPIESNLSINENLIHYLGRNGFDQRITTYSGKRDVSFGYKAFCLATQNGYCVQFDIFQGKDNLPDIGSTIQLNSRENSVLNFAKFLSNSFVGLKFSLYLNECFTTPHVISELTKLNYGGTGILNEKVVKKSKLIDCEKMIIEENIESCINKKNNMIAIRWKNKNNIKKTILSNQYGENPIDPCLLYSKVKKKCINVLQPHSMKMYLQYKSGVDQLDHNVSEYRTGTNEKKWYMPIVLWILDVSVTNAWVLATESGYRGDQLNFRKKLSTSLCKLYGFYDLNDE